MPPDSARPPGILLDVRSTDPLKLATGKILLDEPAMMVRRGRNLHLAAKAADSLRAILGRQSTLRTFDAVEVVDGSPKRRLRGCYLAYDSGRGTPCTVIFARLEPPLE